MQLILERLHAGAPALLVWTRGYAHLATSLALEEQLLLHRKPTPRAYRSRRRGAVDSLRAELAGTCHRCLTDATLQPLSVEPTRQQLYPFDLGLLREIDDPQGPHAMHATRLLGPALFFGHLGALMHTMPLNTNIPKVRRMMDVLYPHSRSILCRFPICMMIAPPSMYKCQQATSALMHCHPNDGYLAKASEFGQVRNESTQSQRMILNLMRKAFTNRNCLQAGHTALSTNNSDFRAYAACRWPADAMSARRRKPPLARSLTGQRKKQFALRKKQKGGEKAAEGAAPKEAKRPAKAKAEAPPTAIVPPPIAGGPADARGGGRARTRIGVR